VYCSRSDSTRNFANSCEILPARKYQRLNILCKQLTASQERSLFKFLPLIFWYAMKFSFCAPDKCHSNQTRRKSSRNLYVLAMPKNDALWGERLKEVSLFKQFRDSSETAQFSILQQPSSLESRLIQGSPECWTKETWTFPRHEVPNPRDFEAMHVKTEDTPST
jgi:hypothetical protein